MNGFGYHVSTATRQREVAENERAIAQYDRVLALPFDLPEWATDGVAETYSVALTSEAHASALGLTIERAAEVADLVDAGDIDWLRSARASEPAKGWYARAQAAVAGLESTYGDRLYGHERTRKLRADAVRRLRTAKKALGAA